MHCSLQRVEVRETKELTGSGISVPDEERAERGGFVTDCFGVKDAGGYPLRISQPILRDHSFVAVGAAQYKTVSGRAGDIAISNKNSASQGSSSFICVLKVLKVLKVSLPSQRSA